MAQAKHITQLSKDKALKKIMAIQVPVTLTRKKNIHLHLVNSIMSQQLSTKVAVVIQKRFIVLCGTKTPGIPLILTKTTEELRSIGLSNAKAAYVHHVCRFFQEHKVTDAALHKMDDEELIAFLTQIKGVGRWTAEMILMFTLGREDVFAVDDLGIQQAMARLYTLDTSDKKALRQQMISMSEKWKPFRTYACLYLWGWKDNVK